MSQNDYKTASSIPPQARFHDDEELHRYVTDEMPRTAKMSSSTAGGVPPSQAALMTVQPLRKNDMQPSYAQDLGSGSVTHGFYGSMISGLGSCIGVLGQFPCCPLPNPYKSVKQGQVGLISRFGQFYKSVDPGLVQVNVCSESMTVVDVKIQLTTVPRQTVQTKDNVSVEVDSVISWHVVSPYRAAFGINNLSYALVERAQTTLRQVVGGRVLQSVISDREGLALEVAEIIEATAEKWGVSIESILLKDINFSPELQQSLSSAATQKRIGESKVIAARAEVDAAKLMRQAADILASPAAMQIRQLEALQAMARNANSKVVFVPMNLGTMGATGIEQVSQQVAASAQDGEGHELYSRNPTTQAGLLTSMTQI
ncbi:Putative band 7 family protein [Vanrija pseudolonga]|uniref:Band 7 family protein n=1 Tax=Vanrija pseudolonga TaxID=143232 RepID=A0AAF1BGF6_9TREE|nr:Putative band 7 family protein [Vanrija pseudolonga]